MSAAQTNKYVINIHGWIKMSKIEHVRQGNSRMERCVIKHHSLFHTEGAETGYRKR